MKKKILIIINVLVIGFFIFTNFSKNVNAFGNDFIINPIAKYEFLDHTNPGKDSMGNYNLNLMYASGYDASNGGVSVSNGVASFNGTAGLVSGSTENDISETLESFTLTYKINSPVVPAGWVEPIGFGWNDWTANKWFTFMYVGDTNLRFTTASVRVPGVDPDTTIGNVDGNANQYWGPVIADISTEKTITITVELGGNIVAYVDGNAVLTYETPENYSLSDPTLQFAMGCVGHWGGQNWWTGELSNVAIYDFALTESQVKDYVQNGNVYKDTNIYVVESKTDLSNEISVPMNFTNEEILRYIPKTSMVQVKMSDDSIISTDVTWNAVKDEEGKKYLVGDITNLPNPNNVKAYAKVSLTEELYVVSPIAKYEFSDASNPGKDSMGNYNLNLMYASGYDASNGGVSVSNGVASFNGTAGLVSGSEENDISEKLESFTLTYKINSPVVPAGWVEPIGFGWNDWTANKWFTFVYVGDTNLRFTTASAKVPGSELDTTVGNVDGNANQYWGAVIADISTEKTITITVELGGNIVAYIDGNAVLTYETPENYSLSDPTLQFAMGCAGHWGGQNWWTGELSNVAIYDFALSDSQVVEYMMYGNVYTDEEIEYAYVVESMTDLTNLVKVPKNTADAEILAYAPKTSTVQVKMSDDTILTSNVLWNSIAVIEGERYLEGNINDLTNPNDVKAYAKILFIDEASIFLPIAKYEFLDPSNPGKDSMGNYDLNLIYASGYNSSNGGISISNGVATFNGTAGLVSGNIENDLTEKLESFTLTYKIKSNEQNSGWAIPAGFGYDDWTPNKWFTFTMLGGSSMLRFTTASSRVPGVDPDTTVSDVDGINGQWWGAELGNVSTEKTITVTVELGGNIVVYVDGNATLTYKTPENYSMSNEILEFALGCAGQWGGQNFFAGELSNVAIYGAALTEKQVKMLNGLTNIKTDLMEKPYISNVSNTPLFEGASTKNPLTMDMSLVEMLENLNPATVIVTLSDNSEMNLDIEWTSVIKNGNVYTAVGEVNTLYCGVLTIVSNVTVEYNLTIHTFGAPVYTWSEDYSTCTATQISDLDSTVIITETMNSSFTVIEPTCSVGETTVYIVIFDGYEYQTQVIEVVSGNPLGHIECVDKGIEPTCTTSGITEGKHCSICNEVLVQQQILEAKNHSFDEIVYEWSQDYSVCVATATCSNDSNHKIQEVVHTTKSVIDATVEAEGSIAYTAEFENELFKVQTNAQTIEKLSDPNDSKKGCSGAIAGTFGVICLLTALVIIYKKKKNYNL